LGRRWKKRGGKEKWGRRRGREGWKSKREGVKRAED